MKKSTVLLVLILLIISTTIGAAMNIPVTKNSSNQIVVALTCSQPLITDSAGYVMVSSETDTSFIITPGAPKLPKITKTVILPYTSTVTSIDPEGKPLDKTQNLFKKILPNAVPTPVSIQSTPQPKEYMNDNIYQSSALYPQNTIDYTISAGLKDGKQVNYLTLHWYPYQYNPKDNILHYTTDVSINISYQSPENPLFSPNLYDLVIIAPDQFTTVLNTLVNHKRDHGVETLLISIEDIYQQYNGRDQAEKIKYFLKDAIETYGINYALLVGSIEITPMRRTAIPFYHDDDILTDLYYADVFDSTGSFSSWDSNNNDKFSEYNWEDGLLEFVDMYPDIHVGRLPCKNIQETKTMVRKIITYETTAAYDSWYQRLLLMGGDTFPNRGKLEGEIVTDNIAEIMNDYGFKPVKLWTSKGNFHPLNINKELSKGAGFVSYSGHGYEQGFGTSPPNGNERIEYFSPYLWGVFNGNKLPVIFFDACSTTKLDFTVEELHDWYATPLVKLFTWFEGERYQMDNYYPCLSWQIVKKVNGGGIASIGSTRVAFTGVDEDGANWGAGFLNTHFFDAYQPDSMLGSLLSSAQIDYLNSVGKECITLEEFVLIGDPSLKLGGYQ